MKKNFRKLDQKVLKKRLTNHSPSSISDRLPVFDIDYDFYFKNNHGMLVVQTQLKYQSFMENKMKQKLIELMQNMEYYEELREDLN